MFGSSGTPGPPHPDWLTALRSLFAARSARSRTIVGNLPVDAAERAAQNAAISFNWMMSGGKVEQHEVERIARATLKELGVATTNITVTQDPHPGQWRVEIQGSHAHLKIRCGQGSTAQWVRAQIFEQYLAQG